MGVLKWMSHYEMHLQFSTIVFPAFIKLNSCSCGKKLPSHLPYTSSERKTYRVNVIVKCGKLGTSNFDAQLQNLHYAQSPRHIRMCWYMEFNWQGKIVFWSPPSCKFRLPAIWSADFSKYSRMKTGSNFSRILFSSSSVQVRYKFPDV